ncbi:MAG: RNA polymerase sigma-70 factor [Saprospiraceae bacterium]|nr:RNA polymerase sigma-70 factor [Saprospiraceae bacterium]
MKYTIKNSVVYLDMLMAMDTHISTLFDQYYSPLCNYVARLIKDEVAAEDVVQELFISLWQKDNLSEVVQIDAYLLRAARFRAIDHLRKISRTAKKEQLSEEILHIPDVVHEIDEETEALFAFTMAKLPPKTREVFLLSRIEGYSYKEIAEKQNVSVKTIENQISNALKIIRQGMAVLVFW